MTYYSYILKSLKTGTYYYGSTANIDKRLKLHNAGKVNYTKPKRPWVLHFSETHLTRSDAFRREYFYKSIDGYNFLKDQGII